MLSPEIVVEDELFVTVAEFDAFIPGEGSGLGLGDELGSGVGDGLEDTSGEGDGLLLGSGVTEGVGEGLEDTELSPVFEFVEAELETVALLSTVVDGDDEGEGLGELVSSAKAYGFGTEYNSIIDTVKNIAIVFLIFTLIFLPLHYRVFVKFL